MNKTLKITLNILIFTLITGFGYYIFYSMRPERKTTPLEENATLTFVSTYEKINSFDANSEILYFDIFENLIYIALFGKVAIFDISGKHQYDFAVEPNVRDIVVCENVVRRGKARLAPTMVYILYPTKIVLHSLNGEKTDEWHACSETSDYCALTTTQDYVFVTDAENKNIVQYDKEGRLVRFIKSPDGFIIPSHSFDIISINDTIYCSNSGRHRIESYTINGEFIASFGKRGSDAGAFAGCCNPAYLEKTHGGYILTSEKGGPRISSYGRDGKFRTILFDSHTLGGGTEAYRMKVCGENILIVGKKTITVYSRDEACNVSSEKSCAGCPMRENCKK